jgi:uncharacterized RmlC-like cupin family protein
MRRGAMLARSAGNQLAFRGKTRNCGSTEMPNSATERVRVIGPGQHYVGKQGFTYGAGASAETVGAEHVCMNILPMPDGARAKAHYHEGVETIAYLLEGECAVYYGANLECRAAMRSGEQMYIPADMPHAPCNESGAACTWIVVHASGSDQEGICLLPELDAALAARLQPGTAAA